MRRSVRHSLCVAAAIVAVAGVACSDSGASTEPSIANLNAGVPPAWFQVGGVQSSYTLGVDHSTVHSGSGALAIFGLDSNPARFNGVGQNIRADSFRGKRLRFRAWVRQAAIAGSDIGIWMRVDGPGVVESFDNFSSRPLTGTSDWHQVEIILDVPDDAIGIGFGALMSGRGELFVDDMTFEIIPATGPTTNQLAGFSDSGRDSAATVASYAGLPVAPTNLGFEAK